MLHQIVVSRIAQVDHDGGIHRLDINERTTSVCGAGNQRGRKATTNKPKSCCGACCILLIRCLGWFRDIYSCQTFGEEAGRCFRIVKRNSRLESPCVWISGNCE